LFWLSGCSSSPSFNGRSGSEAPPKGVLPVQIVRTAKGYQLMRGGKPYVIKGVAGLQQLDRVRAMGGNSIRVYTTKYADALLDEAHRNGLTVMLGLWMKPEYEHFDYFDPEAVRVQREAIRAEVLRYRYHPALLAWNVGNELDNHTNNPRVYQAVNEVVRMIHELDPYHPVTTTVTSRLDLVHALPKHCPDLDFLSVNVFGELGVISNKLISKNWRGPYLIGEFGARGWWEAPATRWKAPLDQSSSVKAEHIRRGFRKTIVGDSSRCLGSYVLYWGQRFEQTNMWFSLFTRQGEKTGVVDVINHLWTGKYPKNRAPILEQLRVNGKQDRDNTYLRPGTSYLAAVQATDPEGDPLRAEWELVPEIDEFKVLPQDRTPPEPIPGLLTPKQGLEATLRTPDQPGPYRLLVSVYDGQGSLATHSFPFYVRP
jgi:hypothetical protein